MACHKATDNRNSRAREGISAARCRPSGRVCRSPSEQVTAGRALAEGLMSADGIPVLYPVCLPLPFEVTAGKSLHVTRPRDTMR